MIAREKDACCVKLKRYTGKNLKQECKKRNLVYETFCITCEKREIKKIEEETEYEKERIRKIKKHEYTGETCRSIFEKTQEHQNDMDQLKPGSHLLKHLLDSCEEEEKEDNRFGVKVVQYTRSSFEKQILESMVI